MVSCHCHGQVKLSQGEDARCLAASASNLWLKSPESVGKEPVEKSARLSWSCAKLLGVSSSTDALVRPSNGDCFSIYGRILSHPPSQSPLQLGEVVAAELD